MSTVVRLPAVTATNPAEILAALSAAPRRLPFDPALVTTLEAVSVAILAAPDLARNAEAVALGFWLRRANLRQLAESFGPDRPGRLRTPVGVAFHIPPANVDTIFAYSWALSFLCANLSVVRLSQRASPLTLRLVGIIDAVLAAHDMAAESAFVTYPREDPATAAFSAACDLRIVWGGDASVTAIRAVPLSPLAREVAFADRLSLALLDARAYLALSPDERDALARRAYGDIYSFDQMACSSPRILVWRGDAALVAEAAGAFDDALRREIGRRGYVVAAATALEKYAAACRAAIDLPIVEIRRDGLAWLVIDLGDAPPAALPRLPIGAGTAIQLRIDRLDALVPLVDRRVQTITHWGFGAAEVEAFARSLAGRGGDRIVPLGEALLFSNLWDGNDLLAAFTRVVAVG